MYHFMMIVDGFCFRPSIHWSWCTHGQPKDIHVVFHVSPMDKSWGTHGHTRDSRRMATERSVFLVGRSWVSYATSMGYPWIGDAQQTYMQGLAH